MTPATFQGTCEAISADEVLTTCVIPAPRERVFQAWTDPALLSQWWGPKDFKNTFHAFDPRPGGAWTFVMHGPDGTDFKNHSEFVEVTAPKRIVFRHASGPYYTATVEFTAQGDQTRITWRMRFDNAAVFSKLKQRILEANPENMTRLQAVLEER